MSVAEDLDGAPLPLAPLRKARVRGRTISIKRLSKRELERGRLLYPDLDVPRPETRADCVQGVNAERPCPFVSCKHHLFLDVSPRSGAIKINFPGLEPHEMSETCALDVADRGGATLEDVGGMMNLTREGVRQLETRGIARLKGLDALAKAAELAGVGEPEASPPEPAETRDRSSFAEDLASHAYLPNASSAPFWGAAAAVGLDQGREQ